MPQPTNTTNTSQLQNQFSQQQGSQNLNTNTSGTQTRDPYSGSLPFLNDIMGQGQSLYNTNQAQLQDPTSLFNQGIGSQSIAASNIQPGTYAAWNDALNTMQGNNAALQAAGGYFGNMANQAGTLNQTAGNMLNTAGLTSSPMSNLQPLAANTSGALTGTQQDILNQNAERLSNRLASQYSGGGRLGSEGAGIGLARGIAETNNPLMAQYNQQNIQNSLGANQGLAGLIGLRGQLQQGAGGLQQGAGSLYAGAGQGQLGIQGAEAQARNSLPGLAQLTMMPGEMQQRLGSAQMSAPWQSLQNYSGAVGGTAPFFGNAGTINTTGNLGTQQNSQNQSIGFANAMGQNIAQQSTPWTTFAGLGLAGAGMLAPSDERLKTDIQKLGKDPHSGLNIYAYRFKGDPKNYPKVAGPMAQEVEKKYPWMVVNVDGVKMIRT